MSWVEYHQGDLVEVSEPETPNGPWLPGVISVGNPRRPNEVAVWYTSSKYGPTERVFPVKRVRLVKAAEERPNVQDRTRQAPEQDLPRAEGRR